MKITTEQILREIAATGTITKKQMQLLKNRSNAQCKDIFNYAIIDRMNVHCSEDFARQGLQWLRSLLKKDGTPRAGVPLGAREIDIIHAATEEDFNFRGFYDAGRYGRFFLPIYEVLGMEYIPYCNGEKIYIIG